jgi:hypothetical protein
VVETTRRSRARPEGIGSMGRRVSLGSIVFSQDDASCDPSVADVDYPFPSMPVLTQEEKRELSSRLAQDRKDQAALSRSAKKKNGKKGRAAVATDESESDVDPSPSKRKVPSTKPGPSSKKKARLDEDESESEGEDELDTGEESEGAQSKKATNKGKAKGKAKRAAKGEGKEKAVGKGKKKFGSGGTLGGAEGALAGSTYRKR